MNDMINHNKVSKNDTYCMVYGIVNEEGCYAQFRVSNVPIDNLPAETVKVLSAGFDVTLNVVPPNKVAAFVKSWDIWERYREEVNADADYLFDILDAFYDYDSTPRWSVYNLGDISRRSVPAPEHVK